MSGSLVPCSVTSHSTLAAHPFLYRTGVCMFGCTKTTHPASSSPLIQMSVAHKKTKNIFCLRRVYSRLSEAVDTALLFAQKIMQGISTIQKSVERPILTKLYS